MGWIFWAFFAYSINICMWSRGKLESFATPPSLITCGSMGPLSFLPWAWAVAFDMDSKCQRHTFPWDPTHSRLPLSPYLTGISPSTIAIRCGKLCQGVSEWRCLLPRLACIYLILNPTQWERKDQLKAVCELFMYLIRPMYHPTQKCMCVFELYNH